MLQEDAARNLTNRPRPGHPSWSGGVCPLGEHKAETKRRRPFHPRTLNAQGMVAGIDIRAIENGGLELFAKQTSENSMWSGSPPAFTICRIF
jgi:hypothetical protein